MGLSSTCGWYYKGLCQPYQRERQSETWELNLFFTGQLAPLSLFLCLIFSCGCWDPVLGKKKEKKKHLIITRGCSYYKKELQLHTVRFCTFIAPFIRLRCNKAAGRTSAGFKWHKSAFLTFSSTSGNSVIKVTNWERCISQVNRVKPFMWNLALVILHHPD